MLYFRSFLPLIISLLKITQINSLRGDLKGPVQRLRRLNGDEIQLHDLVAAHGRVGQPHAEQIRVLALLVDQVLVGRLQIVHLSLDLHVLRAGVRDPNLLRANTDVSHEAPEVVKGVDALVVHAELVRADYHRGAFNLGDDREFALLQPLYVADQIVLEKAADVVEAGDRYGNLGKGRELPGFWGANDGQAWILLKIFYPNCCLDSFGTLSRVFL